MPIYADLDEELAVIKAQLEKARAEKADDSAVDSACPASAENDGHEPTRKRFLRGTETVSDGYFGRLTGEPSRNCDDPTGREYRRHNR
ncbi:MAG: hypothetical protein WCO25_04350 [Candidatus Uhrbacteria bacterium]